MTDRHFFHVFREYLMKHSEFLYCCNDFSIMKHKKIKNEKLQFAKARCHQSSTNFVTSTDLSTRFKGKNYVFMLFDFFETFDCSSIC